MSCLGRFGPNVSSPKPFPALIPFSVRHGAFGLAEYGQVDDSRSGVVKCVQTRNKSHKTIRVF